MKTFKYKAIENKLKAELCNGEHQQGDRFHTERSLAARYGVSPVTVRQALAALVEEGWLERRQGSGTYVCDPYQRRKEDIGVIYIDDFSGNPLLIQTITLIIKAANRRRREVKIFTYRKGMLHLGKDTFNEAIAEKRLSGLLPVSRLNAEELAYLHDSRLSTVLLFNESPISGIGSVISDDNTAVSMMIEHLSSLGHRRIALVNGVGGSALQEAFLGCLSEKGLDCGDGLCSVQQWSEAGGRAGFKKILDTDKRPTAVIAADEQLALGVMHQAADAGLDIPGDLSLIVGSDRLPPQMYPAWPTAMDVDYEAIAEKALDMLLGRKPMINLTIPPRLVIRDTTRGIDRR